MTTISSTSTEYVWVPIRSEHPITGVQDLSAYAVDVAFVRGDPATADWKPATWEASTKTIDGLAYYLARVKVGPAGAVALADGPWSVYGRVTTIDETPVVLSGTIRVT